MEDTPTTKNRYESKDSRLELMAQLNELYSSDFDSKIREYLDISELASESQDMNQEDKQREVLSHMQDVLKQLKRIIGDAMQTNQDLRESIGTIYLIADSIGKKLIDAPDNRYRRDELPNKFGGKEQVPAGRFSYENTKQDIQRLQAVFTGLSIAEKLSQ